MKFPLALRMFSAVLGAVLSLEVEGAAPDFAREVRPIFERHCLKCHGPEKQKGGLRYDLKEGAFKVGESGERAIVPGHASESRMIKLVSSQKEDEWMPPKGERLTAAEIELLKRWIDAGANWPMASMNIAAGTADTKATNRSATHWSFQPLKKPALPKTKIPGAIQSPVDRFVVARLEQSGLAMRKPADARKFARRIYFDLVGLPPKPEEIENFVTAYAADSKRAVAELVDELLASPHYGERWARHWLDVVRYADSDGQESDADRPNAYRFRDFVIHSLNDDSPFDRFVRWQLAGDELEPDNPLAVAATGFIVAGTHAELGPKLLEEERMRERYNELDDMITTTGVAMMGLTLGCARCHDHKYDPIPRRDYYQIMCAFNGGNRAEDPLVPLEEARRRKQQEDAWKKDYDIAKQRLSACEKQKKSYETALRNERIDRLEISNEEKTLLKNKADDAKTKEVAKKFSAELKIEEKEIRARLSEKERAELEASERELHAVEASKPAPMPTAFGFADAGPLPRETFLLARGDFHAKSEPVQLGFLTALTREATPQDYWMRARLDSKRDDSTQQRRAMAEWMTDLDHGAGALVARVIVNRVWQHHFGQGLVRTVNDFGARCDPPTHPELLEWLTSEFVKSGWKIKTLHRLIMNSAVYLQDTTYDAAAAKMDPDDRLLWRRRPSRLEAEVLRDSMLAVSGTLNPAMFGPAVKAPIAPEAIQARNMLDPYPKDIQDTFATHRRSIYIFHKRVVQQPLMQAFDGPDAQASCGRRENTTVAPQALALLNDSIVRASATAFANRTLENAGARVEDQVRWAWLTALGREPTPAELQSSATFIRQQTTKRSARNADEQTNAAKLALADFCQAIFALNEFIYVD
jgi:hypothetical protein